MKKTISIGIVLTLVLTVISGIIAFPGIAHTESDPLVVTLYAGQDIDVGTVEVWNDGDNLHVTYKTTGGWLITETHLYVGKTDPNDLSHSPGQFPYSEPHEPTTEYTYVIDFCDIDSYHLGLNNKGKTTGKWVAEGDTECFDPCDEVDLYIAAHAVVEKETITYDSCMIDFEDFSEYDDVSSVLTDCGLVNFNMVDYLPLIGLSIGETATITVKVDLPVIAEESTMGSDYYGLVAFTSNSGGMKDDLVLDDSGTGAGGKMLTDALDYSQTPLLYHAYTKYQAIMVDVSNIVNVDTLNFVGIDLDHDELWHFQYFDENNVLIADVTVGPGTTGGDGKAYQTDFTDSRINKVAIWGEQNLAIPDRLGFAIDNIEVDTKAIDVQEETAWGDGDEFSTNWATCFEYTTQCPEVEIECPGIVRATSNIEMIFTPPTDVRVGSLESDTHFQFFKEFEGPLPADLQIDLVSGRSAKSDGPDSVLDWFILEGTEVCIFYIQLDNVGSTSTLTKAGSITFGADILGAIISGGDIGTFAFEDLMFDADDMLKPFTGITYPTKDRPDYLRGFDVNHPNNLDDALITGPTIDFTMWVVNAHDSMRIIVPMVPV